MSTDANRKGSLRAGAVYFACVALAHTAGVKIPGLFIYHDVPPHIDQEQIIAFLAPGDRPGRHRRDAVVTRTGGAMRETVAQCKPA